MSSPKPEAKASVEQQVKAGLRAVRDFLAGRSGDAKVAATDDKATRDVVAAELLAKMSAATIGPSADASAAAATQSDTQEIPRHEEEGELGDAKDPEYSQDSNEAVQERERARQLFLEHGYFDDVVQALRTASAPAQRAAAARSLGLVGSPRGTAHLIAAMFDDEPEVRDAAERALTEINDPSLAKEAVHVVNHEITETDFAKSVMTQQGGQDALAPDETAESDSSDPTTGQVETVSVLGHPSALIPLDLQTTNSVPTVAEEQLLLEEHRLREATEQVARQLIETAAARAQSEQEVQSRTEREAGLRAEAAARRSEEEELRKRADEEAEHRRSEEREALMAEQVARARAETEAQRFAEEETHLRIKAVDLRLAVAELARQRGASETARREAAETARQAEAKRARDDAKSRHDAELTRLHREEEALRSTTDEIALRRSEIEAEREQADAEAERLVEAQARMRAAAEASAQAEAERARIEAEINQRMATALRLLEETRRREQEEQERLQEETRRHVEEQQQRLAEMELMKTRAEAESRQLAEKHQQILTEVNRLRFVDAEARKRIEEAEVRKHAAEDAYRLVAEKLQRVEAEAHARAKEEEQMLQKLEAARRTVAVEAQSRAAQEKRIREEIEMFRRLEEQERPRLEAAVLQRSEAQSRLQRARAMAEDRVGGEEKLNAAGQYRVTAAGQSAPNSWQERSENVSSTVTGSGEAPRAFTESLSASDEDGATASDENLVDDIEVATGPVPPSIFAYLNSVDPYKRAAAVAELARSRPQDAFSLIANCFDDSSPHVRNAAARAFRKLEPSRTVDLFNRALEEATDERRRNIGAAIAASGLASEAINNLVGENREETYNALSILFVMAKTGEVEPLVRALEEHPDDEIGKAVMRLLNLSGHSIQ